MKPFANKLIVAGWLLCTVALSLPWMVKPFGGWLSGWFWIALNYFPFYHLVTFREAKFEHLGAYLLIPSVFIMFASPLLLIALNRTCNRLYANVTLIGLVLALVAFVIELFLLLEHKYLDSYVGNLLYVCAYGLLARGFVKQAARLQS